MLCIFLVTHARGHLGTIWSTVLEDGTHFLRMVRILFNSMITEFFGITVLVARFFSEVTNRSVR